MNTKWVPRVRSLLSWSSLVAAVAVAPLLWLILFALISGIILSPFDGLATMGVIYVLSITLFWLLLLLIVLTVMFPFALYFDSTNINTNRLEWQPTTVLYVLGGAIGLFVPLLQQLVALLYLYKRHKYVSLH